MANIKSAIKRIDIAERNRLHNKAYKSAVKTLIKRYVSAVSGYAASPTAESTQDVQTTLSAAFSKIDKAVKRGVIHPNTAARRKARLAKLFKAQESKAAAAGA